MEALRVLLAAFGTFPAVDAGPHDVGGHVLVVPTTYDPEKPAGLLGACHGAGGRAWQMVRTWQAEAERAGLLLLAPQEQGQNAGYRFTEAERGATLDAIRQVRRRFNVDENRIILTGISRGGHLTWDLASRHPDRFAALAPMIGGPRLQIREEQNNLRYLENIAHLPIVDVQGAGDDPRLVANLRLAFDRLENLGAEQAVLHLQAGRGHDFDMSVVDWDAFLREARRDPTPRRVVRRMARKGEGRAAWIEILATKRPTVEVLPLRVGKAWNTLDDAGHRRVQQDAADQRTARLEVTRRARGRFDVRATGVKKFRILLTPEMIDADGRVVVTWKGRTFKRRVKPSARVLLREFAARFDRTF